MQLFEAYQKRHSGSVNRALAETIQAVALLGLARTDFFSHAAFYGGTALRLLYNLDRFSEDLDFSLLKPAKDFQLAAYLGALRGEMEAFGFSVDIEKHQKKFDTPIESAFIKANTRIHVIRAGIPRAIADRIHRNALCKVKLEVDVDPPPDADFEVAYIDDPVPFSLQAYSGPSLFAGKMDAVLSRGWKNRVKGRDWYDFAFLVRKKVPLSLLHLETRLRQKGFYSMEESLDEDLCIQMIEQRIESVDFEAAKTDVIAFIQRPQDLDVWSKAYFRHVLRNMQFTSAA
ncbi:MAG: nucleotidyl transferase AbiEii/AbiGii toxin family protein [Deltaproteobacteria bacterium]|nr:nucleotidyl transferase AbiEii/AbiGii toxin family protein [Deltaproteobacteria bacterium]